MSYVKDLRLQPTLKDLQEHVADIYKANGWHTDKNHEKLTKLAESLTSLKSSIDEIQKLSKEKRITSVVPLELYEKFAWVFAHLMDLANLHSIDMEGAYRESIIKAIPPKEAKPPKTKILIKKQTI